MFALSVVGTPNPLSFSHAMAERAVGVLRELGAEVSHHDLYAEGYEPVRGSDELVMQHRAELAAADILMVFHPNWWSMPPAILKGWIDRTFVPEVAYRDAPVGLPPIGLLKAKALVFNTADTPPERERAVFHDPLQRIWETGIFDFCGIRTVVRRMYSPVTSSTADQSAIWLEEVETLVRASLT